MFQKVLNHHNDPIEDLYIRAQTDGRPNVLNLGIGVYRDAVGNAPIFDCVREAEQRILAKSDTKAYMTPLGNPEYITESEKLIFGSEHSVLASGRVISAQCPGAGAGLRIGAELSKALCPGARAWFSEPVWEHQTEFFTKAGVERKQYAYYEAESCSIDFTAMLNSLEDLKAADLVVIHGCCHNPTGADLSIEQWQQLTDFLIEKQAIPFVDIAYQGYGTSLEDDVLGMQYMASKMDNMLVTLSSSKSFAVYRDRTAMLSIIHSQSHPDPDSLERYFRDIIRGIYFMPPNHAAAVIAEILTNPELTQSWRAEIDMIRSRIRHCRNALADAVSALKPDYPVQQLRNQQGIFSCFSLDQGQLQTLEKEHQLYLLPCVDSRSNQIAYGRINFAAMTEHHADRIAKSICSL